MKRILPILALSLLTMVTLTHCGGGGKATVDAPPPVATPVITSFTANPATIAAGASSSLSWSVTGANSLSLDQGAPAVSGPSGSVAVNPSTTTTYTLTATNASGSATGKATVTVTPGTPVVSVTLTPPVASVQTRATQQMTAVVVGTANTAVTWSVAEGASGGTVTTSGLYTAPATAGTYHVVATSAADSIKTATATITVTTAPPVVSVTLTPATASIQTTATQLFTATVAGTTNTAVTWSVPEGAGGGTVSTSGLYTAPSTAGTYHVVATSGADSTKTATATVTVTTAPPVVSVTLTPATASIQTTATQLFTATVAGSTNTAVTWSVAEGASGGSVSTSGLYTAPSTAGTYRVVATSGADNTKTATATITVTTAPPVVSVTLAPTTASIQTSATQLFTATVAGTANTVVTWSVQEGASGGSVSTSGLYTAPATAGTYRVVATSVADGTKSATATVTVTLLPPSIAYGSATLTAVAGTAITPWTPTNLGGPAASWSVTPPLPAGFTFSTTTGQIGGTPAGTSGPVTYTITATNAAGSGPANLSITVNAAPVLPAFTTQPQSQSVVANATVTFTAVVTGSPTPTLQWQTQDPAASTWANVTTGVGGTTLSYTTQALILADQGRKYRLAATNSQGTTYSTIATVTVTSPLTLPAFTTQPQPQTVAEGATGTFTAVVSGNPTPTLQWQTQDPANTTIWTNASGNSTSASYTTPALTAAADQGRKYRLVATNSQGSATSSVVAVTVIAKPVISSFTASPASISSGGSSTLTWAVSGASSLSLSGVGVVNGTTRSVSPTTTTTYTLTATNLAGDATATATVTVNGTTATTSYVDLYQMPALAHGEQSPWISGERVIVRDNQGAHDLIGFILGSATYPNGNLSAYVSHDNGSTWVWIESAAATPAFTCCPGAVAQDSTGKVHLIAEHLFTSEGGLYSRLALNRDAGGHVVGFLPEVREVKVPMAIDTASEVHFALVCGPDASGHEVVLYAALDNSGIQAGKTKSSVGIAPTLAADFVSLTDAGTATSVLGVAGDPHNNTLQMVQHPASKDLWFQWGPADTMDGTQNNNHPLQRRRAVASGTGWSLQPTLTVDVRNGAANVRTPQAFSACATPSYVWFLRLNDSQGILIDKADAAGNITANALPSPYPTKGAFGSFALVVNPNNETQAYVAGWLSIDADPGRGFWAWYYNGSTWSTFQDKFPSTYLYSNAPNYGVGASSGWDTGLTYSFWDPIAAKLFVATVRTTN